MINKIGLAAGDIWKILKNEGEITITTLRRKAGLPLSVFYMGLGWLSREDKVRYRLEKRRIYISIKT